MSFSSKKGEFDRCFNRLDRPVEESRPDRFPSLSDLIIPGDFFAFLLDIALYIKFIGSLMQNLRVYKCISTAQPGFC